MTTTPPITLPRRLFKYARRTAYAIATAYVVILLLAYTFQERLIFPGSWVHPHTWPDDPIAHSDIELVRLTTPKGNSTAAFFAKATTPAGSPHPNPAGLPTVLLFYGNGDNLRGYLWHLQHLRRLQVNVMIPEYVGYGISPGSPSVANCLDAAEAAFAHLRGRKDIDPNKIVPLGWSLGSGMACALAARHHGAGVSGLIVVSGYTTLEDAGQHQFWFLPVKWLMRQRISSLENIRGVKVPILIAHGTRDPAIPYRMSLELAAAATASPRVTHVRMEGIGHNDVFADGYDQIMSAIAKFVAESAGGGSER